MSASPLGTRTSIPTASPRKSSPSASPSPQPKDLAPKGLSLMPISLK